MRELLTVQVGQAGVQVGDTCWELLSREHSLRPDGTFSPDPPRPDTLSNNPLFSETSGGRIVPRTLFVDLEPTVVDQVRRGRYRDLYSPASFVCGKEDGASNFARGHYSIGRGRVDQCTDQIRKLVEQCDSFQGFLLFNSLGGGTGAGFGALLNNRLNREYKHKTQFQFSVFPSPTLSPVIVEPYNAVFSVSNSQEHDSPDTQVLFDNESLYKVCTRYLDIERPTYSDLNGLICRVVSSVTALLRFEGCPISTDLHTIQTNLIPYPRIKYLSATHGPLVSPEKANHARLSVRDMTLSSFESAARTLNLDLPRGKLLASCLLYRGHITPGEINTAITALKSMRSMKRVSWIPNNFKVGIVWEQPPVSSSDPMYRSLCSLSNHSGIETTFGDLNWKFDKLHSRRAFQHWFLGEGMEECEFSRAREETSDLEMEYNLENHPYCCHHPFGPLYEEDEE